MRLSEKQLQKLSVETVSGTKLGKVRDVIFETEGQTIIAYVVTHHLWSTQEYLVHREQVVRFEEHALIVDDAVGKVSTENTVDPDSLAQPEAAMRVEN